LVEDAGISEALVGENGDVTESMESESAVKQAPEVATPASTPDDSKYPEEVHKKMSEMKTILRNSN